MDLTPCNLYLNGIKLLIFFFRSIFLKNVSLNFFAFPRYSIPKIMVFHAKSGSLDAISYKNAR